jgi:hypothetical protein
MRTRIAFVIVAVSVGLLAAGYVWGASGPTSAPAVTSSSVRIKDEKVHREYVNVTRVSMGPQGEEVILELGILSNDEVHPDDFTFEVTTRAYMNVIEAKKLAMTLNQLIDRYEQSFGNVELDPRKRMKKP